MRKGFYSVKLMGPLVLRTTANDTFSFVDTSLGPLLSALDSVLNIVRLIVVGKSPTLNAYTLSASAAQLIPSSPAL